MKILYLITKSNPGGAQRYVLDMALGARKAGCVAVVAAGSGGPLLSHLEHERIRTITLSHAQRDIHLFKEVRLFFQLLTLIRKERPDVLHVNSAKLGGLGAFAGRLCSVRRIIFTVHGWSFLEEHRTWRWRLLAYCFSWLTSFFAHATITVSRCDFTAGTRFLFLRKKMYYIPLGIDAPSLLAKQDARSKLVQGSTMDEYWVGMIGELTHNKDYKVALDAFALFAKDRPSARLIIIGDGELKDELAGYLTQQNNSQEISQEIIGRVRFLGFIEQAATYLSAFDCFLITSSKEGLPYVVLEAAHAGIPIIATSVGGIPDSIESGYCGTLVASKDYVGFANALSHYADDAQSARVHAARMYEKTAQSFTLSGMVGTTLTLYKITNA